MRFHSRFATAIAALSLFSLTGCIPPVEDRLNNQGGGNIVTAAAKVASQQLSSLTPDEIQAAADLAIQQFGAPIQPLSDDEAAAVARFLKDNLLNKVEDIQALANNPDSVVISPEVQAAVISFLQGLGADVNFDGPVLSQSTD
jgi:hypothetical protein